MDVFLTGGTGYVGTSVLKALLADGHAVTALARSDAAAGTLTAAGATVVRGGLDDVAVLAAAAEAADAVIHTASPGDASSADLDAGVVEAFLPVLGSKPWLHTGGAWVFGSKPEIDEDSAFDPPALTAWRLPVEAKVLAAGGTVVAPGIVYGRGGGLAAMLAGGPVDGGALLFPGTGDQHWTTVHVDDLAELYVLALRAPRGSYFIGAGGENPTVRAIAEAASHGRGLGGAVAPEPAADTAARLGPLAEAFDLDQQASGSRARADLGWEPSHKSILDELSTGSYVPA